MMNKHIKEFVRLVNENPDVEVICMVNSDICNGDYQYNCGDIEKPRLDEYCNYGDMIYFQRDEVIEQVVDELEDTLSDDEAYADAKFVVDNMEWKKCIVVYVEP